MQINVSLMDNRKSI